MAAGSGARLEWKAEAGKAASTTRAQQAQRPVEGIGGAVGQHSQRRARRRQPHGHHCDASPPRLSAAGLEREPLASPRPLYVSPPPLQAGAHCGRQPGA